MRSIFKLTSVTTLAAALALGCAMDMGDDGHGPGGKADDGNAFNVKYDPSIPFIVPEPVHNYLETYQWGEYHVIYHMTRRWFVLGDNGRNYLKTLSEQNADLQEGDGRSGIEFLAMHSAMIEHLREKWGDLAIEGNPDAKTFGEVLDGYATDESMAAHIKAAGRSDATFQKAVLRLNDFASFATEDDFGLYLQTTLRLSTMVNEDDTFQRFYDQSQETGAGIHNALHGYFSDPSSPIDVGNPKTNLSNIRFWGIHGWIEAKWQAFQKVHVRTPSEQEIYDYQMERFRLHMWIHSPDAFGPPEHMDTVPDELCKEIGPKVFNNDVYCADVEPGVVMPGCLPPAAPPP